MVLYDQSGEELAAALDSLAASVAHAIRRGVAADAVLWLGDCSDRPCMDAAHLDSVREATGRAGIATVSYAHFGTNLGFGGGHNRLAEGAREDVMLVLNPDTYCSPYVVEELLSTLNDPSVGLVDAKQLPLEHPKSYDLSTGDTSWALGACFMMPTRIFREIDGFDDRSFFLYCEDVDLSWRVKLAGFRVVHNPNAKFFHDKQLDDDGVFIPAAREPEESSESALLLAYKFSRDDMVQKFLDHFDTSGLPFHARAAKRFRDRMASGDLPARIDLDHRVGQFVGFDFAEHNFSYAD